eukprot:1067421-Amphidinium_carterae.1
MRNGSELCFGGLGRRTGPFAKHLMSSGEIEALVNLAESRCSERAHFSDACGCQCQANHFMYESA